MINPVVSEILRQGRRLPVDRRTRKRRIKAALETGRIESNFTNPAGGDADSAGWRQERASLYADPTNVRKSVMRFYGEAAKLDRGQKSYQLAADVQRPAAQYRGRYKTASSEAESLLHGGGGTGAGAAPSRVQLGVRQSFDQAGFDQAQRRARLGSFLAQRHGTGGILFRTGVLGTTAPNQGDFTSSQLTSRVIPGQDAAAAPGRRSVDTAARAAAKQLGVREINSSNRGPQVDQLQKKFGMIGQPWCGILVGTALRKAGVHITSRVASVQAIEQDARSGANGFKSWHSPRDAQTGDALVTAKGQHVGLVVSVDRKRGIIHTIEGNTGNGEVARRAHRMSDVYGIARPRYRRG